MFSDCGQINNTGTSPRSDCLQYTFFTRSLLFLDYDTYYQRCTVTLNYLVTATAMKCRLCLKEDNSGHLCTTIHLNATSKEKTHEVRNG